MRTRVLVVDDHAVAQQAICSLLERSGEVEVVGTAGGGFEALEAIRALQPDLVLLDLMMPDLDGFEVLALLQTESQRPKVVVLSMNDSSGTISKAIAKGASGYVCKIRAYRDLMWVIKVVLEA